MLYEKKEDYLTLISNLYQLTDENEKWNMMRYLCRNDLFFLGWFVFSREDFYHDWVFARCKEVEEHPDGYLDMWARGHYKSSIITFLKTIQDILRGHGEGKVKVCGVYEPSFGIFSFSRPIAKAFLRQIKIAFESNELLKYLFPDILFENSNDSPKWSEDDGLIVKRESTKKESTIEAWGLVDSQPTSKHFTILIYDDVVTRESVTSEVMSNKVLETFELSTNLGVYRGAKRIIGTRYHFNDLYQHIIDKGIAKERKYPATEDGTPKGKPVLYDQAYIDQRYNEMGQYIFASQMLLNPVHDSKIAFNYKWINFYDDKKMSWRDLNIYILVDPANSKSKYSDYTAMAVIGLGANGTIFLIEMVRDKLNLAERTQKLFGLIRKYNPLKVGYEQYGMQADVQYVLEKKKEQHMRFTLVEMKGKVAKKDRILNLGARFEGGQVYLPNVQIQTDFEGKPFNVIDAFINHEYLTFPFCQHDDMLDVFSRILDADLNARWPMSGRNGKISVQKAVSGMIA